MIIRLIEEDGKVAVKSSFHPLVSVLLFVGGLFIVLLFVIIGIDDKAFPFLSTGKPLGFPGFIPVIFFFGAISASSYRNILMADSRQIELKTGFFFFMETKTMIPVEKCEGLYLQPSGKGKTTLFIKMGDSYFNTFLKDRVKKIEETADKISSVTGLKKALVSDKGDNLPFRGKIKIFMMKNKAEAGAEVKTETETKS